LVVPPPLPKRASPSASADGAARPLPWLEREFGWSETSAYRFIQIGERFADNVPTVGSFRIELRALEFLSARPRCRPRSPRGHAHSEWTGRTSHTAKSDREPPNVQNPWMSLSTLPAIARGLVSLRQFG